MEGKSTKGVLSFLSVLEVQARNRTHPQPKNRIDELKSTLEALIVQRDQLKAKIKANTKLRTFMDKDGTCEGEEDIEDNSEHSQILRLMARHTELEDLLHAHHLIGGYDIIQTRQGKGVSVSLATAYEGVCLETYHLEMDLTARLRITRHNIPPFIPLESLAEQSNMQTDIRAFLDTLSQHLNAFAGRKQQLKLVKELHKSVDVIESNALCTIIVLVFTVPEETPITAHCTLNYSDHTRCLPTQVNIECEDEELPGSSQWEKNRTLTLFLGTPLHVALETLKTTKVIV